MRADTVTGDILKPESPPMPIKTSYILCLAALLVGCASVPVGDHPDFNTKILATVKSMPTGGGYDTSDATKNLLRGACSVLNDGRILVDANRAKPSFCSGATYLLLLRAMDNDAEEMLPQIDQKDGHGVFGRWNANGPGAAKLVADLHAGKNFTSWHEARPGDFLKIWWTEKIGGREHGHHVVYLGHDAKTVHFWSSNKPGGYGTKSALRSDCRRVLFTRITHPENFTAVRKLPPTDPWLARMLQDDFSWDEVAAKCRVSD
jgi:hypothetical protein